MGVRRRGPRGRPRVPTRARCRRGDCRWWAGRRRASRFGWVTDPEGNRIELWQPAW